MANLDLATGEKWWLEIRAQGTVPVGAVGVGETALGEGQTMASVEK